MGACNEHVKPTIETRPASIANSTPGLRDPLPHLRFRIRYRGHWLRLCATHEEPCVEFEKGWSESVKSGLQDGVCTMRQGERPIFPCGKSED